MTLQFSPSCKLKIVCAIFVIWRRGPTKLWKPSKAVTVAVDVIVVAVVVVVAAVVVVVVVIVGGSVFGFAALDNPRNGFQLFNWNEFIKKVWLRQPETQTPITSSIFETFESTRSAFSLLLNLIMMIRLTLMRWQAASWDVESRGNSSNCDIPKKHFHFESSSLQENHSFSDARVLQKDNSVNSIYQQGFEPITSVRCLQVSGFSS